MATLQQEPNKYDFFIAKATKQWESSGRGNRKGTGDKPVEVKKILKSCVMQPPTQSTPLRSAP